MLATVKLSKGNFDKETPKAYGLDLDSNRNLTWLPKSQISVFEDTNEPEYCRTYLVVMPIWLAKQKGFWGYNYFGQEICTLIEDGQLAQVPQNWKQVN